MLFIIFALTAHNHSHQITLHLSLITKPTQQWPVLTSSANRHSHGIRKYNGAPQKMLKMETGQALYRSAQSPWKLPCSRAAANPSVSYLEQFVREKRTLWAEPGWWRILPCWTNWGEAHAWSISVREVLPIDVIGCTYFETLMVTDVTQRSMCSDDLPSSLP